MPKIRPIVQLSLIGALVAWYQLPVMAERSHALTLPGHEQLADTLDNATATVGQPAVALRAWTEQSKLELQAGLLEVASMAPPRADAIASPIVSPQQALGTADTTAVRTTAVPAAIAAVSASAAATAGTPTTGANGSTGSAPPQSPATTTGQAPEQPSKVAVPKGEKGVVAVLAGDSVMGEIAYGVQRWAAKTRSWTVIDAHKVSSGLSNTGYYNWPTTFHNLLEAHHPDVVLMMVGANDAQDILENKRRHAFGTAGWQEVYSQRVHTILDDAAAHCTTVYWHLMPIAREPGFEKKMALVRKVIRDAAERHGATVRLVDPNERFMDSSGRYMESTRINGKTKALRTDDGIHLTVAGAQIFVDTVLEDAEKHPVKKASCTAP